MANKSQEKDIVNGNLESVVEIFAPYSSLLPEIVQFNEDVYTHRLNGVSLEYAKIIASRSLDANHRIKIAEKALKIDGLTGLKRKEQLDSILDERLGRYSREGLGLSYVVIDLREFKKINDTYGHSMGDIAIRTIGDIIREEIRSNDEGIRTGGDEFGIVLDGKNTEDNINQLIKRIRDRYERSMLENHNITTSFDAGYTTFPLGNVSYRLELKNPDKKSEYIEQIKKLADQAMYFSKHGDRKPVHIPVIVAV